MKIEKTLFALLFTLPMNFQQTDEAKLKEMAAKLKDYPIKFELIAIGRPALPYLMEQVGSKDEWLSFESQSTARWIVQNALHDNKEKENLTDALAKYCEKTRPIPARQFAMELLGELNSPKAIPVLAAAIASEDEACSTAVQALARIEGREANAALNSRLNDLKKASWTPALVELLHKSPESLISHLKELSPEARSAAMATLGQSDDPKAFDALRDLAMEGVAGAFDAFMNAMSKQKPETAIMYCRIAKGIAKTPERQFLALCKLGELGDKEAAPALLAATKNEETRDKAWASYLKLADRLSPAEAKDLYLQTIQNKPEERFVIRAITGLARSQDSQLAATLSPFLESENQKFQWTAFSVLRDLPGAEANKLLIITAKNPRNSPMLGGVIEALGRRGEAESVGALREWAEAGASEIRPIALSAYLQVANKLPASQSKEMYLFAFQAGETDIALRGLIKVGGAEALPSLLSMLDKADETLRGQIRGTLEAIGERVAAEGNKADALKAYRAALDAGAAVENRLRELGESVEITARGGRVDCWWVIGPFDAPTQKAWEKPEFPEKAIKLDKSYQEGERKLHWIPVQSGGENAAINLDSMFDPNDMVTAYAYAKIIVPKETAATLLMGSDDGMICWLNGEKVNSVLMPRGMKPDQDKIPVKLKAGENQLLVKVCEIGGGWEFCLRIEDDQNRPLKFKIR